ncbi:hypothetical protein ACET3Z_016851 [Daucus carota]
MRLFGLKIPLSTLCFGQVCRFYGKVPPEIDELKGLERLDLSRYNSSENEPANYVWSSSGEYADDGDDIEYERWFLISVVQYLEI